MKHAGVVWMFATMSAILPGQSPGQAPWQWRAWNRERPNTLLVGLGANSGLAGLRYGRTLGDTPLGLGLGVSSEGYVPYLEITAADGFPSSQHVYVGIGELIGWDKRTRAAPLIEFGDRIWLGRSKRVFTELGVAFIQFRDSPWFVLPLVFPHVQVGMAF